MEQMVELSIVVGNDYTSKLMKTIPLKHALGEVQEYGTAEKIPRIKGQLVGTNLSELFQCTANDS